MTDGDRSESDRHSQQVPEEPRPFHHHLQRHPPQSGENQDRGDPQRNVVQQHRTLQAEPAYPQQAADRRAHGRESAARLACHSGLCEGGFRAPRVQQFGRLERPAGALQAAGACELDGLGRGANTQTGQA